MISLTWIDFLIRLIPEALIIILAGYAISKKNLNVKPYLLSAIILALLTFLFRILPISIIISMLLSAITAVILLIYINKIKTIHAILSIIICLILSALAEGANIIFLGNVFKLDTNKIFLESSTLLKNLYGLPSLLLFGIIILSYYFISSKKRNT